MIDTNKRGRKKIKVDNENEVKGISQMRFEKT